MSTYRPDWPPLTADLAARAIVAAARAIGDDPVRAATVMGSERIGLYAGMKAVSIACDCSLVRLAAVFRFAHSSVLGCRKRHRDRFDYALTAALLAIGGAKAEPAPDPHASPSPRSEPEPAIEGAHRRVEPPIALPAPVQAPPVPKPAVMTACGASERTRARLAEAVRKRSETLAAAPRPKAHRPASRRAPRELVDADDVPELNGRML